jgi:hypothetical protein
MERRVMVPAIDAKRTAVSCQPLGVVKVQPQVITAGVPRKTCGPHLWFITCACRITENGNPGYRLSPVDHHGNR